VQALSDWRIDSPAGQGLLLGFANFSRREEAERAVQGLAQLFKHAN
jgi:GntR family transcriptional regulator/MocR family aminotransferase